MLARKHSSISFHSRGGQGGSSRCEHCGRDAWSTLPSQFRLRHPPQPPLGTAWAAPQHGGSPTIRPCHPPPPPLGTAWATPQHGGSPTIRLNVSPPHPTTRYGMGDAPARGLANQHSMAREHGLLIDFVPVTFAATNHHIVTLGVAVGDKPLTHPY